MPRVLPLRGALVVLLLLGVLFTAEARRLDAFEAESLEDEPRLPAAPVVAPRGTRIREAGAPAAARLSSNPPCLSCRWMMRSLALWLSSPGNAAATAEQRTLQAQALCQQKDISFQLAVECKAYVDTRAWLEKAGAAGAEPQATAAELLAHPERYCVNVGLCRDATYYPHAATLVPAVNRTGSAVVRFRLAFNSTEIPRATRGFPEFVSAMVKGLARLVRANPARMEMHFHRDQPWAELLIKPASQVPAPLRTWGDRKAEVSSVLIAQEIRAAIIDGTNEAPQLMYLDRRWQPQVFAMKNSDVGEQV